MFISRILEQIRSVAYVAFAAVLAIFFAGNDAVEIGNDVFKMNIDYIDKLPEEIFPLPKTDDTLRFTVLGDQGGLPYSPFFTKIQTEIAHRMGKIATQRREQFIIALGDNFYYDGVNSTRDPRFKESFEDVYRAESLQVPWYVIAGNHDHFGVVKAQIQYSQLSKRWNFPYYNYTFALPFDNSSVSARFVMVDTVILCGNSDRDYHGQQPSGAEDALTAGTMLQWVEDVLKHSRDDYLFVCGHYPVYSVGHHGPTHCLIDRLEPLLHKYNVTAYLNGHDHNLQHIQVTDTRYRTTVDYFTDGAANFIDPETSHRHKVPRDSLKFFWGDIMAFGGFAGINLARRSGNFTFYQANGTALYTYPLKPRIFHQ